MGHWSRFELYQILKILPVVPEYFALFLDNFLSPEYYSARVSPSLKAVCSRRFTKGFLFLVWTDTPALPVMKQPKF